MANKFYLHKIIIVFNSFLLILNIIYLFPKKCILKPQIKFRFSENFYLIFMNKTYLEIASYLNNKFERFYHNFTLTNNKTKNKKIIKIYFLKFFKGYDPNSLIRNLDNEKFIFKYDNNTPDYLIYNTVFSKMHNVKKYKNAIKIAFSTENKIPDLNEADYAIGYIHLNYFDRYFKFFKYFNLKLINIIINSRKYALKTKKRKLFLFIY